MKKVMGIKKPWFHYRTMVRFGNYSPRAIVQVVAIREPNKLLVW
jgi:hypothetical protein